MEGLVETSNNLASVQISENKVTIVCSTRSSISEALESQRERIKIMSRAFDATVEQEEAYPGWALTLTLQFLRLLPKYIRIYLEKTLIYVQYTQD